MTNSYSIRKCLAFQTHMDEVILAMMFAAINREFGEGNCIYRATIWRWSKTLLWILPPYINALGNW